MKKKNLSIWPENILNLPVAEDPDELLYNSLLNIGYDVKSYYEDSIFAFKRRFTPNNLLINNRNDLLKMVYSVYKEFSKIRSSY